ncbi:MAG: hypothetical protein CME83_03575 [Candidatus Heimdallarchaeota archaeon]|nr:hypothetical protein [Candidatus Heimdallarchaeota archaeon]
MVKGVEKLTHFGNYLELSGNAIPYTMDNKGKISGAVYTSDNGGDVLVASSNFWMDNYGAKAKYTANVQGQEFDAILSEQLWDWFSRENKIIKQSDNFENNKFSATFLLTDNGSLDTSANPIAYLRATSTLDKTSIDVVSEGNGLYSFEYEIGSEDGVYEIVVEYGDDYISFNEEFIDKTAPFVSFSADYPNGTIYPEDSSMFIIELIVKDEVDVITKSDITLSVNGNELTDLRVSYNSETGEFRTILNTDNLGDISIGVPVYLTIDVNDNSGNSATYVYEFYIGEPISTEQNSEVITTESELTETEATYFEGYWVFLAVSLLSIVTKISSIKRNNVMR